MCIKVSHRVSHSLTFFLQTLAQVSILVSKKHKLNILYGELARLTKLTCNGLSTFSVSHTHQTYTFMWTLASTNHSLTSPLKPQEISLSSSVISCFTCAEMYDQPHQWLAMVSLSSLKWWWLLPVCRLRSHSDSPRWRMRCRPYQGPGSRPWPKGRATAYDLVP